MDGEEWRPVVGWEGLYEVSSLGRVRSLGRHVVSRGRYWVPGKTLSPADDSDGYKIVGLRGGGQKQTATVHKLVANAFLGLKPAPHLQCRHLDGVKTNNASSNLEWSDSKTNIRDKAKHGTQCRGEMVGISKLSESDVVAILEAVARGEGKKAIASRYGISDETVRHIQRGKTWAHVTAPRTATKKFSPRMTNETAARIKAALALGRVPQQISRDFGVGHASVHSIRKGLTYKDVKPAS